MLTHPKISFIIIFLCLIFFSAAHAQDTLVKQKKNIIKVNISSGFVYDIPLLFEYERILSSHRSITIQTGYSTLPFETNIDSLRWTTDIQNSGFSITLDYRFYLRKENKDASPHGVYLAPFASYHRFANERELAFGTDSRVIPLNVKSTYNFLSVGGALGYQFTFGKRWVLDCLFLGPSICYYKVEMKLTGDIPESEITGLTQDMLEALARRFPLVNSLLKDEIANFTGTASSWNYGFRYSIHFGYRF
jgi:hypothetical protein